MKSARERFFFLHDETIYRLKILGTKVKGDREYNS